MPQSEALRDYAMTLDDATAKAAKDGYDIRPFLIAAAVEQLGEPWRIIRASDPGGFGTLHIDHRAAPTPEAMSERARIVEAACSAQLAPGMSLVVWLISRATISKHDERADKLFTVKRTVVPVIIKCDWGADVIALFDAEAS